ncbi:MAG: hypothetical protein KKF56_05030 [Nanoarchaeota archaeon]|nr:hypothetical protein [Nanoarchaeota archaeon]
MAWWIWISIIFGTMVITGTGIALIKLRQARGRIEVTANQPLCENLCRTEFTDGYGLGIVTQQLPRKNGTTFIEYIPLDIEQGEEIPQPPKQSLIVKDEFIKRLARGEGFSRREYMKFVARSKVDLPEKMRDTDEGRWETKEGQLAHIQNVFGQGIISGDEAIAEAMKQYARGQIPKSTLAQIKEINEKIREMQMTKNLEQEQGGEKK